MQLLIINPGATSTKLAIFRDEEEVFRRNIVHTERELAPFARVIDQAEFRLALIRDALAEFGCTMQQFDAVCSRGGLLRHIPSGAYRVTDAVIADVLDPPYGEHASNLGVYLGKALADPAGIPAFFVDPVSVDELTGVARVSGLEGMQRESFFHALNHKSMARKAAAQLGKPYEELNLIVAHLGGGVSVGAHRRGRVVDVNNVKDEGAFSMDRGGSLPVNAVVNLCFGGKSKQEVKKLIGSNAGVASYLGTRDFREVEARMEAGEEKAKLVFEALAYQLAKDIGQMAVALCCEVDAIVLTGGMAYSRKFCDAIEAYVSRLAPVIELPGEEEMRSLAEGALRVLRGEAAKEYEMEAEHAQHI